MADSPVVLRWLELHRQLSEAAHDSQSVSFGMLANFDSLVPEERELIFPLLGKWLLSDDNRLRYDSRFIISQRCVYQLIADARCALAAIEQKPGPEAKHEAVHLRRIIKDLTAGPTS